MSARMSRWERMALHPERAVGALITMSGLLRAVIWWIDRDMARRAVPEVAENLHRHGLWPQGRCPDDD